MFNNKLKIEWKQKTTNRRYYENIWTMGLCKDETIYQFSTSKYHLFINNKFTHPNTLIHNTSCHACNAFYDLFSFIDYYFIELHKMYICTITNTHSILCNTVPPLLSALGLPCSLWWCPPRVFCCPSTHPSPIGCGICIEYKRMEANILRMRYGWKHEDLVRM